MWSGEKIASLRKRHRQTQSQFAEYIGVSVDTLQNWEQGRVPAPPIAGKLFDRIEADSNQAREPVEALSAS